MWMLVVIFCILFIVETSVKSIGCIGTFEKSTEEETLLPIEATVDESHRSIFGRQTSSATGSPRLHKNMPKVAGELKWSSELQSQVSRMSNMLEQIHHP